MENIFLPVSCGEIKIQSPDQGHLNFKLNLGLNPVSHSLGARVQFCGIHLSVSKEPTEKSVPQNCMFKFLHNLHFAPL